MPIMYKTPSYKFIAQAAMALCAILLFIGVATAEEQAIENTATGIFKAQTTTLDNGMQVVFIPNHRAPIATHMVWIKAGAVDEPQGIAGLAHFLEHLMFKGTKTTKPGEFSRTVKSYGAEHNAFTSKDYTAYFETVATKYLDEVMDLNADRLRNLAPPEEEIISEQLVVLEERRQRVDNNPKAQFREHLIASYYLTHPYARPVIGWMEEVERISWSNAQAFYNKYYVPNNMILVVTGDLEFEEVVEKAQKHYGKLKPKSLPEKSTPVLPNLVGTKSLTYSGPSIHQDQFIKFFTAPSYLENKKDSLALQVLEEMIDGRPTTYLHDEIVVNQKLASSISVYYSDIARYQTEIIISGNPNEGTSPEDLDIAVHKAFQNLAENGLDQNRFEQAKDRLIAEAVYARDSLSGPAMILGRALSSGVKLEDIEQWDKQIASVELNDVERVFSRYLVDHDRMPATGYLKAMTEKGMQKGAKPDDDDKRTGQNEQ